MGENGLNRTSKVSVFDPAVLGPAACDTAETETTPARPRNRAEMAAMRTVLRMTPPPGGGRRRPASRVRLSPRQGSTRLRPRDHSVPISRRRGERVLSGSCGRRAARGKPGYALMKAGELHPVNIGRRWDETVR